MQSHVLNYTSGDVSHEHYITLLSIFVLLTTLTINLKITVHENKTKSLLKEFFSHCSVNREHELNARLDWRASYQNIGPENGKEAFSLW